ncbi:MAG: phospholipid carrier-dependent glycosyltransferase [Chloroflexi bacterium]|nr:phospholipid carrier-dependent glycosyltransferase [Chloroflexota bacterium]
MFGLALTSANQKSPAYDEQSYIVRGLGYLRGENRHMRVGHPLGLNALSASLLVADDHIALPTDDPSWQKTSFHRPAELFLWEIGNDVERVMFLARLPMIWLGMLLAAVVGRWAQEMGRNRLAGLLALSLVALDPNILAHARLTTTDLGLAAGATLVGFLLWRFWKRPSWNTAVFAGIGFGLLQNTKFTAGLFVPLLALVMLAFVAARWRGDGRFPTKMTLQLLIAFPLAAFFTLWAAYGFQLGTLPENLPTFSQLGGLTMPLAHHLEQLLDIGGRMQKATPSFLLGQYSDSGWPYYFPVAFLLKTPLPTLILLIWAFVRAVSKKGRDNDASRITTHHVSHITAVDLAALLIPSLGYFAIALTTDINLGYRHLLPILPFFAVFIASQFPIHNLQFTIHNSSVSLLVVWLAAISLWIFPHYLTYFNALAGGPDNGWRYLVDSNIDWGQDLAGLKGWMDENGVERVWLSYFGEARPDYYGIDYTGLDSSPPRLMDPGARPFYPHDPAPGIYAISATNLQGALFDNHDQFAWFRDREPMAKVGYSIFLYEVAARGQPVDLLLSGVQLDEIEPADFGQLGTNAVSPHWFAANQSWLFPAVADHWLVLSNNDVLQWQPEIAVAYELVITGDDYRLFRRREPLPPALEATAVFSDGDAGQVSWLGGEILLTDDGQMVAQTKWRQEGKERPLKVFIHVVDSSGAIIAQWDGLGAHWRGWRAGDVLWQNHVVQIPDEIKPDDYAIWLGVYDPDSGTRWRATTDEDRLLLETIALP